MKNTNSDFKNKVARIGKILRNIFVNGLSELFKDSKFDKMKKFIEEHKFIIITLIIILLFILKNFYTIFSYNLEIKEAKAEIARQTGVNEQLKEDIKYYKTDEFILRYALEELNLRPTEKLDIYHGELLPKKDEEQSESTEEDGAITAEDRTSKEDEEDGNNESGNGSIKENITEENKIDTE